mgnify:CR=1 FL=1
MPRVGRIVVPGARHHITQRGNNREDVFFVEDDRQVYLELLRAQGERFGFRLEAYCLMTNHVHLVGVPAAEDALAKAIGRCHFLYTQYINRTHGRSGHLWQNRFYSCALDEGHAVNAVAYVELNPVRARMVKDAWDYPWSSAAVHCGKAAHSPYLDLTVWRQAFSAKDWRMTLSNILQDAPICDALRRSTHTGRPLGSDAFISKVEHALGRRIRALPIGRPKGWRKRKRQDTANSQQGREERGDK